jgi:uncharacterized membrane protein
LPIILLVRSANSTTVYRSLTDSTGRIIISLHKGSYEADAVIDLPSTPGVDAASTSAFQIPSEGNATLVFYPAGSLAGKIVKNGSLVAGAQVRVSCPSSAFDYERINGGKSVQAGQAGDFLFPTLPAGTCIVSANADSLAGSKQAGILQGKMSYVQIELEPKAESSSSLLAQAALIAAFALFFAALRTLKKPAISKDKDAQAQGIRRSFGQNEPSPQVASAKPKEEEMQAYALSPDSPKAKAVLATLSEREREIVLFLFKNNGRAKRSQIQHKLLIPKTSLLRNLRSLERKNIVKLVPFGRNLLAQLEESIFK